MKKYILLILTIVFSANFVNASFVADKKNTIIEAYKNKVAIIAIKNVIKSQDKYSKKRNIQAISNIYSDNFVSFDGFDKNAYIELIKDTWKAYPDITYSCKIKNIDIKGNNASVNVYETAFATSLNTENGYPLYGELNSNSTGTYYLKEYNKKWLITGEKVESETSALKFGEARFTNMKLESPKTIKAKDYYTVSLNVDTPQNSLVIASINQDKIVFPLEKSEDVFRKMPDDNILERMFTANEENKNEYNVATIGITRAEKTPRNTIRYYMSGIAYLMNRVNFEVENAK